MVGYFLKILGYGWKLDVYKTGDYKFLASKKIILEFWRVKWMKKKAKTVTYIDFDMQVNFYSSLVSSKSHDAILTYENYRVHIGHKQDT